MFIILDYSSALEYSIIRRYTNIVYYYYYYKTRCSKYVTIFLHDSIIFNSKKTVCIKLGITLLNDKILFFCIYYAGSDGGFTIDHIISFSTIISAKQLCCFHVFSIMVLY